MEETASDKNVSVKKGSQLAIFFQQQNLGAQLYWYTGMKIRLDTSVIG